MDIRRARFNSLLQDAIDQLDDGRIIITIQQVRRSRQIIGQRIQISPIAQGCFSCFRQIALRVNAGHQPFELGSIHRLTLNGLSDNAASFENGVERRIFEGRQYRFPALLQRNHAVATRETIG